MRLRSTHNPPQFSIFVDECQQFCGYEDFAVLFTEARKYGVARMEVLRACANEIEGLNMKEAIENIVKIWELLRKPETLSRWQAEDTYKKRCHPSSMPR